MTTDELIRALPIGDLGVEEAEPHLQVPSADVGRVVVAGALFFAVSRLCVLMGAAVVATQQATIESGRSTAPDVARLTDGGTSLTRRVLAILTSWDGQWYLTITRYGYPDDIPSRVNGSMLEARAAFFPFYPYLVRAVDAVLPGGAATAAVLTNVVAGCAAVCLVGVLGLRLYDERIARRAMLIFAVFPGSFVLSFGYAEALFISLAAGVLILLHADRWIAAGTLAAVASMTRPTGLAVVIGCVVAGVIAWRRRRAWQPIAGALLAVGGFLAPLALIGMRSGEAGAWFRVQREAWDEGVSFGWSTVRAVWDAVVAPLESPQSALALFTVVALIVLVAASARERLPSVPMAYSLATAALMVLPATVSARPRFLLVAFPLFIGLAAWTLSPRRSPALRSPQLGMLLVGVSCAGLTALTAVYGSASAVP